MALNRLNQKQVVGDNGYTYETLQTQLSELEGRTRIPAKLIYNTHTQWVNGEEKTNIDFIENLDAITIAAGQTSATFVSYIIDTGGFSSVKFNKLEIESQSGAEYGSLVFETRTADTEEAITVATWTVLGTTNKINSINGRYIQFKITMTKATYAPIVTSVSIVLYGAAATQETYDARGGYKTLSERLNKMNDMARVEYIAIAGQKIFALPSGYIAVDDGQRIFIYVGGALQKYGLNEGYTFNENGVSVIFTEGLVEGDVVTIIAYRSGISSTSSSPSPPSTVTSIVAYDYDIGLVTNEETKTFNMPFANQGIIKGIKCLGDYTTGDFYLNVYTKDPATGGSYIYASGKVTTTLWDIMEIPFVDESGTNQIYCELYNMGVNSNFTLKIYINI